MPFHPYLYFDGNCREAFTRYQEIFGGELLMASDVYGDFVPAAGMYVHYSTTDIDRAKAIFAGLSDGGEVRQEGREEFWTPFYGSVVDRFGIPWQISVEPAAEGEG